MNDFTKDELREIYGCVNSIVCLGNPSTNYFFPLLNKIESMIENYCEHKNIGSYNDADYVYFCRDCAAVTGAI